MSGVYALTMCAWICDRFALGPPFAIAYADADFDDAGFDFLLKIPNKEDNIHVHRCHPRVCVSDARRPRGPRFA